jgi:two-component system alkaline phosphatase synthesis response regulator PhoP
MLGKRILSVEDDPDIAELLAFHLRGEGYEVRTLPDGNHAIATIENFEPDAVLLDVMLPGMSGYEICRRYRSQYPESKVPILLLTARGAEDDVVRGLEAGADDYITKPFSVRVLMAKVKRAVLRNDSREQHGEMIKIMDLQIDPARHEVTFLGEVLDLTSSEFKTLHFLASRPGWVFTRNQIMAAVHGEGYIVSERSIDVMIVGLRKKMHAAGAYIETVRGVGYRFTD